MGIGPMTFSLRERRSATELNRLLTFLFHLSTLPYFLISSLSLFMLERFHGVGAAYKILVLGTPVRFWVEPPFCLIFFLFFFFFFFSKNSSIRKATMGIGPMTFSLRERRSATELNRLSSYFFFFFILLSFSSSSFL